MTEQMISEAREISKDQQPVTAVTYLTSLFSCTEKQADQLVKIAEELGNQRLAVERLQAIERKLFALPRCNGSVYWRDQSDIMYLNHGHDVDCPYCGPCEGKRRIRRYIGKDKAKQDAGKQAIKNMNEWIEAKRAVRLAREKYLSIEARLTKVLVVPTYQRGWM